MTPAYQLVVTRRATCDLSKLHGHTAGPLPPGASGLVRKVFAAFDSLCQVPHRTVVFPQPPDRRPPVRSLPVPPYMIYFRAYDDRKLVVVSRVRHRARRPLRRFD